LSDYQGKNIRSHFSGIKEGKDSGPFKVNVSQCKVSEGEKGDEQYTAINGGISSGVRPPTCEQKKSLPPHPEPYGTIFLLLLVGTCGGGEKR